MPKAAMTSHDLLLASLRSFGLGVLAINGDEIDKVIAKIHFAQADKYFGWAKKRMKASKSK